MAELAERKAEELPAGKERELLLRKVRQVANALHLDQLLSRKLR
jgi:hypothetical protein